MGCTYSTESKGESVQRQTKGLLRPSMDPLSSLNQPVKLVFKVLLIGDSGVGKTQLMKGLCGQEFDERAIATIGVDILHKQMLPLGEEALMDTAEKREVTFQMVDTVGQEKWRSITETYYRSANIALICFRIGDESSQAAVHSWYKDLKTRSSTVTDANVLIVGTCRDLQESDRIPLSPFSSDEQLKHLAYFEVSSKTGELASLENFFQGRADSAWLKRGQSVAQSQRSSIKRSVEFF